MCVTSKCWPSDLALSHARSFGAAVPGPRKSDFSCRALPNFGTVASCNQYRLVVSEFTGISAPSQFLAYI